MTRGFTKLNKHRIKFFKGVQICKWCVHNIRTGVKFVLALQWRHNGCNSVSNHQPSECLLSCLIRRRSKKPSKLCVTGLCAGNSPETGEFPAQRASYVENVSIWWCHHEISLQLCITDVEKWNCHLISNTNSATGRILFKPWK